MAKQDKEKEQSEPPKLSDFDKLIKKAIDTPKPKKKSKDENNNKKTISANH